MRERRERTRIHGRELERGTRQRIRQLFHKLLDKLLLASKKKLIHNRIGKLLQTVLCGPGPGQRAIHRREPRHNHHGY
jgi:hypothetical protein